MSKISVQCRGDRIYEFSPATTVLLVIDLQKEFFVEANNAHLVERLVDCDPKARAARYVCVAVFADPGGIPIVTEGEASGVVLDEPRGNGGFGYDPYIFDAVVGKTFAEMTGAEKDGRSHRGMAFRRLADILRARSG